MTAISIHNLALQERAGIWNVKSRGDVKLYLPSNSDIWRARHIVPVSTVYPVFWGKDFDGATSDNVRPAEIQDGSHNCGLVRKRSYSGCIGQQHTFNGYLYISECSNKVQHIWKLSNVCVSEKSKMAPLNR